MRGGSKSEDSSLGRVHAGIISATGQTGLKMDRRTLLKGLGTAVASAAAATAPAITRGLPDVTVVGAGAFGAWTALCLRERGANVLLLDSYGAGNALQTSGDE